MVKNPPAMCRPGFDPWVGKMPWRREQLPTPVFWPGESHGLDSPRDCKESNMTEQLSLNFTSKPHHCLPPLLPPPALNLPSNSKSETYQGCHVLGKSAQKGFAFILQFCHVPPNTSGETLSKRVLVHFKNSQPHLLFWSLMRWSVPCQSIRCSPIGSKLYVSWFLSWGFSDMPCSVATGLSSQLLYLEVQSFMCYGANTDQCNGGWR